MPDIFSGVQKDLVVSLIKHELSKSVNAALAAGLPVGEAVHELERRRHVLKSSRTRASGTRNDGGDATASGHPSDEDR